MKIDLLYFDDCPSWQPALANLQTAIKEENLDVSVHLVQVTSDQEAMDHQFLGVSVFPSRWRRFLANPPGSLFIELSSLFYFGRVEGLADR